MYSYFVRLGQHRVTKNGQPVLKSSTVAAKPAPDRATTNQPRFNPLCTRLTVLLTKMLRVRPDRCSFQRNGSR